MCDLLSLNLINYVTSSHLLNKYPTIKKLKERLAPGDPRLFDHQTTIANCPGLELDLLDLFSGIFLTTPGTDRLAKAPVTALS